MTEKDTPVEGAQPRPDELVDKLEDVKSTPPDTEAGDEWPELGEPGGVERTGANRGVSGEGTERTEGQDPNIQAGGGQAGG